MQTQSELFTGSASDSVRSYSVSAIKQPLNSLGFIYTPSISYFSFNHPQFLQMPPSFFKILLDPSSSHMQLPRDFVSMHMKNKIPNAPIIRSANGGYSWRLKIKKIGDSYCFVNGWKNVVEDIQLEFGDFLYFRLVDQSIFKMSIYSPNGCEKILPMKIDHDDDDDDDDHDNIKEKDEVNANNIDDDDDEDEDPFSTSILIKSHRSFLRFPSGFAESVGIKAEGTMTLKNLEGKEWVMGLKLDKSFRASVRYFLSSGWPRFRRENDLSEGDECVFRFVRSEGKLLLAKVTKKKSPPFCEPPATTVVKTGRGGRVHEDGGDVDIVEEGVEVMNRPFEMPPMDLRGMPPKQKSRVIYF